MKANNVDCVYNQELGKARQHICRLGGFIIWNNNLHQLEQSGPKRVRDNKLPNYFAFLAGDGILLHKEHGMINFERIGIELTDDKHDKKNQLAMWKVVMK